MIATLTPRQKQILTYMEEHLLREQRLPTFRELMTNFGIRNPNAIACHMKPLIRKGYLAAAHGLARGYKLILGADGFPFRLQRREDCL